MPGWEPLSERGNGRSPRKSGAEGRAGRRFQSRFCHTRRSEAMRKPWPSPSFRPAIAGTASPRTAIGDAAVASCDGCQHAAMGCQAEWVEWVVLGARTTAPSPLSDAAPGSSRTDSKAATRDSGSHPPRPAEPARNGASLVRQMAFYKSCAWKPLSAPDYDCIFPSAAWASLFKSVMASASLRFGA